MLEGSMEFEGEMRVETVKESSFLCKGSDIRFLIGPKSNQGSNQKLMLLPLSMFQEMPFLRRESSLSILRLI